MGDTATSRARWGDRARAWIAAISLTWVAVGAFVTILSANQVPTSNGADIIRLQDDARTVDGRLNALERLNLDHRLTSVEEITREISEDRTEERKLWYTIVGGVAGVIVLQVLGLRKERERRGR